VVVLAVKDGYLKAIIVGQVLGAVEAGETSSDDENAVRVLHGGIIDACALSAILPRIMICD